MATAHSRPLCSFSVDRWSPHRGLNSGPHSYQECALPLSYVGSRLGQLQRAVRAKPEGPHTRSTALCWCREEDSNLRSTRRQIYSLLGLTAPQSLHRLISYHTNNQQHNPVTKIVTQQTKNLDRPARDPGTQTTESHPSECIGVPPLSQQFWSPGGDSNPPTCRLQIGCAAVAPPGLKPDNTLTLIVIA